MTETPPAPRQCLRADETPTSQQMSQAVRDFCDWTTREKPQQRDHCIAVWDRIAQKSADCSTHQKCPPLQHALPLCPGQPELRGRVR